MAKLSDVDPLFLSFQVALAGRYSIDRELGRGGMGVVYLAREVDLDRLVAIKLLPPEKARDPVIRERFLREARHAAKLSHPNIIPIHAVEEHGEFVFYVMAYINGETLAERVRSRGPLTTSEGGRVLREVAWALAHAHSQGLIHRDVKPDNILLEFTSGRVLVTDFGIAFAAQEAQQATPSGTPEFMSPEQALGRDVDARSDVYSLGITAFYALSGRLPFEGANATEVLARQVTEPAPQLASLELPVSRKLAGLVDRCVAKDPAQRPASADVLAEQLGVALEQRRDLPVALRAWVKRTGRLNGGGTIAAIALAGSTLGPAILRDHLGWWLLGTGGLAFGSLVWSARKLLRHGFAHVDVGPAYAAEIDQSNEEALVEHGRGRSVSETIALTIAWVSGAVFVPVVVAALLGVDSPLLEYLVFSGPISITALTIYLGLLDRRKDVDSGFWSKLWTGKIGKAAFWVANKLLGKKRPVSAVTHRATELALGLASESLFESLPAEIRRGLGDVPVLVRQLQDDAQRLRRLYEELQDGLASTGDASGADAHGALRAERDRVHGKLTEAVGALETIRLNLLRLHAGSGTVEALTTHIDLAAEVAAEAERLLGARAEVERMLRFPRTIAPTPA